MAEPIIDNITVSPDPVPIGGTATVTILAHDPDQKSYTVSGTATDTSGNDATFTVTINVADPLTYQATVDEGVLTQDTAKPNVFRWTA